MGGLLILLILTPLLRFDSSLILIIIGARAGLIIVLSQPLILQFISVSVLALSIIILTAYLSALFLIASKDFRSTLLRGSFLLLLILLVFMFTVLDLVDFYILFELRAIPMSICILG